MVWKSSPSTIQSLLRLPAALRRSVYTSATAQPEIFDVVCVGGGPAGLSFVNALRAHPSSQQLKIALIDSQDLTSSRSISSPETYSNRCSSLTPSSLRFLHRIGATQLLDHARTQPYHAMDVWDGVSGSKVHFDPIDGTTPSIADLIPGSRFRESRREYEVEDEGVVARMCENNNLTGALLERLNELQDVELLDKTKVESIQFGQEPQVDTGPDLSQWPIVSLPDSRQLAARLLVGADGANSPVRAFADIPSQGWDYGRHGVVATLTLDREFTDAEIRTAYQRFLPTGPIALLPLPGNKASLVWSTTVAHATKLKQLAPVDFAAMVNAAFRLLAVDIDYILSRLPSGHAEEVAWRERSTNMTELGLSAAMPKAIDVQERSIASFPLRMRHASTYTSHRVALLGDAAHTIHPLAGQGLNLGLADAESLSKCIVNGVETGMDIGSCWCLDSYNNERWAANNAMLGVVDKLHKVYSASSGPVVWGRSLGLDLVEKLGPVKGMLMGAAAGR